MKMLRVNMKEGRISWDAVPQQYERLGGRALIAKLLLETLAATFWP